MPGQLLQRLPGDADLILSAAQLLVSWFRSGRCRTEAALAALAGASPIPARNS